MTFEILEKTEIPNKKFSDKVPDFSKLESKDLKPPSDLGSKVPVFDRCDFSAAEINQDEKLQSIEREKIREYSPYTDIVNDSITSNAELEIYTSIGLDEKEIGDRKALCRDDIDLEKVDDDGLSNLDRMSKGRPPLDNNNRPIELHHIGQSSDSPFAELTQSEHRGQGNNVILHDGTQDTKIDRILFQSEKSQYWKTRAEHFRRDMT